MDAQESKQKFQQADAYFHQGKYSEALQLLNELNRVFPNNQNVMFPALLCLEKLGRLREANGLCDQLIQRFNDNRARQVKARLVPRPSEATAMPRIPGITKSGGGLVGPGIEMDIGGAGEGVAGINPNALAGLLDDDLSPRKPPPVPPARRASSGGGAVTYVIWGVAIIGYLIIAGICVGKGISAFLVAAQAVQQTGGEPQFGGDFYLYYFMSCILVVFPAYVAGLYLGLKVVGKLPHNDFIEDIKASALTNLIMGLLSLIPLVGWIIALVYLNKKFELGCGGLIAVVLLQGIVATVLSGIVVAALLPVAAMFF